MWLLSGWRLAAVAVGLQPAVRAGVYSRSTVQSIDVEPDEFEARLLRCFKLTAAGSIDAD